MSALRLERLAYRLLGSVADAEDVVQEARARLLAQREAPLNESAWLVRVVTNLALDRLRARQRQAYPGPWVPEPLDTSAEPDAVSELAEELSLGLMMMLERLSPAERAVFVLREGFDYSFAEISELLDVSAAACRQRFRRAKAGLAAEPELETPLPEQQALIERLVRAIAEQDHDAVVALFDEDAVVYADGGGVVSAAIRPVTDRERIARVLLHLAAKTSREGELSLELAQLNGGVGLLIRQDGQLHSTLQLDGREGRIRHLYFVRNPAKLERLAGASGSSSD